MVFRKKEIAWLKQRIADLEAENTRMQQVFNYVTDDASSPFYNIAILSKLFNISGIGIWMCPPEVDKLWISTISRDIFGYKSDFSPTLEQFKNSILPEDKPVFDKALFEVRQGLKISEFELKIARPEGDGREFRLVSMNMTHIEQEAHGEEKIYGIAGYVKDITRQDKTKRDLIKAKEKAEEAERLKNSLLANISHEIRTPMNSIIGFSELLNIGNLPYNKRLEYVRTIKNQGVLLLKMIDDVVELTRIETGKATIRKSPCNIDLLINELLFVFNQYKVSQNKGHLEIKIKFPESRGKVIYTDPGRLQQLIWSLISNSIKYTKKGGIEIGYKPISEQRIEFYVKDTGIGLSPDLQKKLFSRMAEEEASGKSEANGLGLTIAKNLIRLMGGKIWVESELGLGSTFFFTIPYEEVPDSYNVMGPEEEYVMPSYTWKDKVILVVEDDEINFKFLEAVLQDTSAQVLRASNGMQAIELCRSISKIDLVLMDIKMPEIDGFEATRKIREFNRKVPIIAQTAYIDEGDFKKCEEIGCNDYITKPIDIKEFYEKVDTFLKEK